MDSELDHLTVELAAVAIEGAKGVGKTSTALQRARTVHRLDRAAERDLARADPDRLTQGTAPILVDEWQRWPESWDVLRRAVDDGAPPGSFVITGSASPAGLGTHSGAGRIVRVRMRPMTLVERGVGEPSVSLAELIRGSQPPVMGTTDLRLADYAGEICATGFPALRPLSPRIRSAQLAGYVDQIIDRDFPELGHQVRIPATLRAWLQAYAAAVSTSTSFEAIRDAATGGQAEKPARTTTLPYRDVLTRLWILDPVPAWLPTRNHLSKLTGGPTHQLADPGLAAHLLGADVDGLLHDGPLLGRLFQSLATQQVLVFAQGAGARVGHLRTFGGQHEVDLIVERPDQRVVAVEVKMSQAIDDDDVRHLVWLRERVGADLLDAVVLTTGREAYRRGDGIAVIPLSLLGP